MRLKIYKVQAYHDEPPMEWTLQQYGDLVWRELFMELVYFS